MRYISFIKVESFIVCLLYFSTSEVFWSWLSLFHHYSFTVHAQRCLYSLRVYHVSTIYLLPNLIHQPVLSLSRLSQGVRIAGSYLNRGENDIEWSKMLIIYWIILPVEVLSCRQLGFGIGVGLFCVCCLPQPARYESVDLLYVCQQTLSFCSSRDRQLLCNTVALFTLSILSTLFRLSLLSSISTL